MWNIMPSEDENMIAESVRGFLASELPLERLRPKAKTVDAAALFKSMGELGWFGVGLPEACGGSGLGLVEEMLIQREMGRYVASPCVLAMVLAGHVCAQAGDAVRAAGLTSGGQSVALALISPDATGAASAQVFDWKAGDPIIAWTDAGMGLFPAEAFTGSDKDDCIDDSLSLHTGQLALDKPIHWIAAEFTDLRARARVLLAASLVGLADGACTLTVDYARIREQFGKPIGSFQAVKHRCADMGVRSRLAWYQTCIAALKVSADAGDAALQADSALVVSADAAHENGRASVQMHGAIGFQAECDVHWFVKRAHVYDLLAGGHRAVARGLATFPVAA